QAMLCCEYKDQITIRQSCVVRRRNQPAAWLLRERVDSLADGGRTLNGSNRLDPERGGRSFHRPREIHSATSCQVRIEQDPDARNAWCNLLWVLDLFGGSGLRRG